MYGEGYTKYHCEWEAGKPLPASAVSELNHWRGEMYRRHWIGYDEAQAVGFGNISRRQAPGSGAFIISGTQTGHLALLGPEHYTLVTRADIAHNRLHCRGPVQASSESLTHAAVYALPEAYAAVIHIHHLGLWEAWYDRLPTTAAEVPYGTPEMAREIQRLHAETDLPTRQVCVMGGHREGLLSFGHSLEAAAQALIGLVSPSR
ncbi:MAG: class II aldolase/adducin family protein [Bacteroidetes bacterium]|nr:MAG: class II aldolase/adducin family protein [Bacteroidota bacterium]